MSVSSTETLFVPKGFKFVPVANASVQDILTQQPDNQTLIQIEHPYKEFSPETVANINDVVVSKSCEVITDLFELDNSPEVKHQGVNIMVSPVGAVSTIAQILARLKQEGKVGIENLNFHYCIPDKTDEKNPKYHFYKYKQANVGEQLVEIEENFQSDEPMVMVDDLFDTLGTYESTRKIFNNTIAICGLGKGLGDKAKEQFSTLEKYHELYPDNSLNGNKPGINIINHNSKIALNRPSINMVTLAEHVWITSGLGMDGGLNLMTNDIETLSLVETVERLFPACMYGAFQNPQEYIEYMQEINPIDLNINEQFFFIYQDIVKAKREFGHNNPAPYIAKIQQLFQDVAAGQLQIAA